MTPSGNRAVTLAMNEAPARMLTDLRWKAEEAVRIYIGGTCNPQWDRWNRILRLPEYFQIPAHLKHKTRVDMN